MGCKWALEYVCIIWYLNLNQRLKTGMHELTLHNLARSMKQIDYLKTSGRSNIFVIFSHFQQYEMPEISFKNSYTTKES